MAGFYSKISSVRRVNAVVVGHISSAVSGRMECQMVRRIGLFVLLLYLNSNCSETVNLRVGMTFNYLVSSILGNSFQKIDLPSPVEISLQEKLIKILQIEYGIGYNSRTEYAEIETTTMDPNAPSYTLLYSGKASFESRLNYLNTYVLPTVDLDLFPIHIFFKIGPHLEYYMNTYTKDFDNNRSIVINSNAEKFIFSTSQRTGVYVTLGKINLGIEFMCLENITRIFKSGNVSFLNFNINPLIGYQF